MKECNGHIQHFSSPGENAACCLPGPREGKSCCQTMVSRDCDHHVTVVPISQIRESQRGVVPRVSQLIKEVTAKCPCWDTFSTALQILSHFFCSLWVETGPLHFCSGLEKPRGQKDFVNSGSILLFEAPFQVSTGLRIHARMTSEHFPSRASKHWAELASRVSSQAAVVLLCPPKINIWKLKT